jgi:hypothetical protein
MKGITCRRDRWEDALRESRNKLLFQCTAILSLALLGAFSDAARAAVGAGSALSFDGADDYVVIAPTSSLSGTFTVEAWGNPSHPTTASALVGTRTPGEYSFDFKFDTGDKIHGDIGDGTGWFTTSADANFPYSVGTWYHIAYVVTPTNYTIYVNGAQVGSGALRFATPPLLYDSTHRLRLGHSGAEPMSGLVDEVRIWNTARTQAEIQMNHGIFDVVVDGEIGAVYHIECSDAVAGLWSEAAVFTNLQPVTTIHLSTNAHRSQFYRARVQ